MCLLTAQNKLQSDLSVETEISEFRYALTEEVISRLPISLSVFLLFPQESRRRVPFHRPASATRVELWRHLVAAKQLCMWKSEMLHIGSDNAKKKKKKKLCCLTVGKFSFPPGSRVATYFLGFKVYPQRESSHQNNRTPWYPTEVSSSGFSLQGGQNQFQVNLQALVLNVCFPVCFHGHQGLGGEAVHAVAGLLDWSALVLHTRSQHSPH